MMSDLETAKRLAEIHTGEHPVVSGPARQTWEQLVAVTDELLADLATARDAS